MGGQYFGSSVLKLTQTPNGLPLTDYFTPYNQATLSQMDLDLSSAGVLVLPDQPGAHPHLAVATGKQGILDLLERENMGHYKPAGDTQIVQEVSPGAGGEVNGVPVYWNGKLYVFGGVSPIKALSLNNGLFSTTPVVQSATLIGGGHPATISANGIPMEFCGSSTVRTCKHTARARSNSFIRPRTRAREIRCPPRRILSLKPSPMERCMWRPGRIWWFMDYFRLYSRWRETTKQLL